MGFWRRRKSEDGARDYAWGHGSQAEAALAEQSGILLLSRWAPPAEVADGWHGAEQEGRWTTANAAIALRARPCWASAAVACTNHHGMAQTVDFTSGGTTLQVTFAPCEEREVVIPYGDGPSLLRIVCNPIQPRAYGVEDSRELGIFVKSVAYCEN
jgi:hypothetical protein